MSRIEAQFHVGVDCAEIERWRRMLPELSNGPSKILFSKREHRYCLSYPDPAPHYAARWCGKEAVYKAVSSFVQLDLRLIEIVNDRRGRPLVVLPPSARLRGIKIDVSLSHSRETAFAAALAYGAPRRVKPSSAVPIK